MQVRAVRGGQYLSTENRFIDNGETVTDAVTSLTWQKTPVGPMTWQEALIYAEGLTLPGYDDWRLPNVNELLSIVDYSKYPAIDSAFTFFLNFSSFYYYTSTTFNSWWGGYTNRSWFVEFGSGQLAADDKDRDDIYVRLVCSGECGPLGASGSFVFDPIAGQVAAGVGFPVRVEARTVGGALDTSVNGNISLTANYGNIYPVMLHFVNGVAADTVTVYGQLLPLWTGRAVNFVTSGSGWPFFHSPRGKSGISHGLNC